MTEEEYLKTRLDDQINWYNKKAKTNKILTQWSKSLVILFSASIPLMAGFDFLNNPSKNITLGVLGSLISIISGISGILKFQDKWTEYRNSAEILMHEKMLFQTSSSPFDKQDQPFGFFVNRIENILSNEQNSWNKYINKDT